jgi:hypothetical protein
MNGPTLCLDRRAWRRWRVEVAAMRMLRDACQRHLDSFGTTIDWDMRALEHINHVTGGRPDGGSGSSGAGASNKRGGSGNSAPPVTERGIGGLAAMIVLRIEDKQLVRFHLECAQAYLERHGSELWAKGVGGTGRGGAGGGRAGGEPPRSERGERGPWDDEEAEKEEGSRQWQQADRRRRWEAWWKPRLDGHMYLSSC